MLGIVLLLIALYLYFKPRYRYLSYLLYLSFMLGSSGGGFGILIDKVIGVKNGDMAVVYTFFISLHLILTNRYKFPHAKFMWWYKLFLVFFICDIAFSYIHYGFSFYQILQGGRSYLLIFSLPILFRIKPDELQKLMPILFWITLVTAVLFFCQIIVGQPLMPYDAEPEKDGATGLLRIYNSPALLDLFLALTFVAPRYFGKRVNLYRAIFLVALVCTLGRTGIFSTLMIVILSMLFLGKASKLLKTIAIVGFLLIPFIGMISERFDSGGTSEDLSALSASGFKDYNMGEGGTLTYRIAWVYERFDYLIHRPIGEQIFGLGLISDSQPIVNKKYNFMIGLRDESTGETYQLYTPDISYGNLLSRHGFVGSIIYLCMLVNFAIFLYKDRKANAFTIVCSAMIIMLFVGSISGSALSEPKNFVMYFIAMATIFQKYSEYPFKREKDKALFSKIN